MQAVVKKLFTVFDTDRGISHALNKLRKSEFQNCKKIRKKCTCFQKNQRIHFIRATPCQIVRKLKKKLLVFKKINKLIS